MPIDDSYIQPTDTNDEKESAARAQLERRSALIASWRQAQQERRREEWRRDAKERRAFERRLEGKEVRPHSSRKRLPHECRDDVRRRYNREAMRKRRGKTEETVRSYEWLGDLTEEQKKQRRADRRREARAMERAAATVRARLKQF